MSNPGALRDWIEALPSAGRYSFTRAEAAAAFARSDAAIKMTLYRLKRSGAIVSPRRDFFVVVPAEYRAAGCPPPSWFVDDLLRHLGRRYYVSLLSAAALHGAGHQQPMAFQVIADAIERDIEVGRVRIELHASNLVTGAATTRLPTETGTMVVATPETTAFDLVRFHASCGHWSNVATVLGELAARLNPALLAAGSQRVARSDIQRLGWLLDLVGHRRLALALEETLVDHRLAPTLLSPGWDAAGAERNDRWHLVINDVVEPDS